MIQLKEGCRVKIFQIFSMSIDLRFLNGKRLYDRVHSYREEYVYGIFMSGSPRKILVLFARVCVLHIRKDTDASYARMQQDNGWGSLEENM